jgi:diketogulonate reductase-like aldo/keto reductase
MQFIDLRGAKVPVLGFGTFRMKGDSCAEAVAHALTAGYRHLDTAEIYGNEEAVANGIRSARLDRHKLFITTKAWMEDLSTNGVRRSLEGSLKRLDTDYVDLWLVHWPNPAFPLRDTLAAMGELATEGKVRYLGVSNFPTALFNEAAAMAPIVCNQVEYHPYLSQKSVLAAARARDAFVTAYAPVAMGTVKDDPILQEIGTHHGKTAAQVTLRWLIQQPGVVAIPKAAALRHIEENLDVFDFSLTDAEMARIRGLARGERLIDPDDGPDWDRE